MAGGRTTPAGTLRGRSALCPETLEPTHPPRCVRLIFYPSSHPPVHCPSLLPVAPPPPPPTPSVCPLTTVGLAPAPPPSKELEGWAWLLQVGEGHSCVSAAQAGRAGGQCGFLEAGAGRARWPGPESWRCPWHTSRATGQPGGSSWSGGGSGEVRPGLRLEEAVRLSPNTPSRRQARPAVTTTPCRLASAPAPRASEGTPR